MLDMIHYLCFTQITDACIAFQPFHTILKYTLLHVLILDAKNLVSTPSLKYSSKKKVKSLKTVTNILLVRKLKGLLKKSFSYPYQWTLFLPLPSDVFFLARGSLLLLTDAGIPRSSPPTFPLPRLTLVTGGKSLSSPPWFFRTRTDLGASFFQQ